MQSLCLFIRYQIHIYQSLLGQPEAELGPRDARVRGKQAPAMHSGILVLKVLVAQSCLTLCDPMDCNLQDSSVPGVLQARRLGWVAVPSSRGSFLTQGLDLGLPHCRQTLPSEPPESLCSLKNHTMMERNTALWELLGSICVSWGSPTNKRSRTSRVARQTER